MRVLRSVSQARHLCGTCRSVVELDAHPQFVDLLVAQQRGGLHLIGFGNLVVGIGDPFREIGVIGEQQQAAAIEIQPADGRKPGPGIGGEVVNGGTSFRISPCRKVSLRLIQQNIGRVCGFERLAVERDAIVFKVDPMIRFSTTRPFTRTQPRGSNCGIVRDAIPAFEKRRSSVLSGRICLLVPMLQ